MSDFVVLLYCGCGLCCLWQHSPQPQYSNITPIVLHTLTHLPKIRQACYTFVIPSRCDGAPEELLEALEQDVTENVATGEGYNWRAKEVRDLWTLALVIVGYVCFFCTCLLLGRFYSPPGMVTG